MVAVEADVFGGIRSLLSCPEEQLPHSSVRRAEEVMKGPWSFQIELPHAEGPSLARQDPAD